MQVFWDQSAMHYDHETRVIDHKQTDVPARNSLVGMKAMYYDWKDSDLIVKTEEVYWERDEAREGCDATGRT